MKRSSHIRATLSRALFHTHPARHRTQGGRTLSVPCTHNNTQQCDNISQNIIFLKGFFLLSKRICIICSDIW